MLNKTNKWAGVYIRARAPQMMDVSSNAAKVAANRPARLSQKVAGRPGNRRQW